MCVCELRSGGRRCQPAIGKMPRQVEIVKQWVEVLNIMSTRVLQYTIVVEDQQNVLGASTSHTDLFPA